MTGKPTISMEAAIWCLDVLQHHGRYEAMMQLKERIAMSDEKRVAPAQGATPRTDRATYTVKQIGRASCRERVCQYV